MSMIRRSVLVAGDEDTDDDATGGGDDGTDGTGNGGNGGMPGFEVLSLFGAIGVMLLYFTTKRKRS